MGKISVRSSQRPATNYGLIIWEALLCQRIPSPGIGNTTEVGNQGAMEGLVSRFIPRHGSSELETLRSHLLSQVVDGGTLGHPFAGDKIRTEGS